MRYLLPFVTLAITAFSATSCSRNEDESSTNQSWIYGKWNVTEISEKRDGPYSSAASLGWYAQFNSDGTYSSRSDNYYTGTYTVSGNTIKAKVYNETVVYNFMEKTANTATASMYYQSEPQYVLYFKVKKQ